MVKVYGPAFSLDASGSLADALTFSKWKGRNYVRERVVPSNPKSGAQMGRRAMFTFLAQNWAGLSVAEQATWQDLADELIASPFNAFVSHNMRFWHNFLPPTQEDPRLAANNGSDRALTLANWEENRIKITATATTANQQWGMIIYGSTQIGFTPSVGNVLMVVLDEDIISHDYYYTPDEAAIWYLDSQAFSDDGVLEALGGVVNSGAP